MENPDRRASAPDYMDHMVMERSIRVACTKEQAQQIEEALKDVELFTMCLVFACLKPLDAAERQFVLDAANMSLQRA